MNICKLCKENEATKTNSHIITWALIKDVVNQSGFKERDYDVTFVISTFDASSLYVGRNVLPEHIEKVTKRDVEDNVVDYINNPFSRDFIFCPICEKNIGILENEFINRVYRKLEKNDDCFYDKKGNKVFTFSNEDAKLIYLLAYSIFFRTSIVNFCNYYVESRIEEDMRQVLKSVLTDDSKKLSFNINQLNESKLSYPLILCYLESESKEDDNRNLIVQNHSNQPYFIWANKLVFNLFKKETHIKSSNEYLFGFSQEVNFKDYFPTNRWVEMPVCIISNSKKEKILLNTLDRVAKLNMNNMKSFFNEACKKILNRKATIDETNRFAHYYSIYITETFQNNIKEAVVKAFASTFGIEE